MADTSDFKLLGGDELKEAMEQRHILMEDVQKVIEYAERTGNRLVNRATGHFLAYHKPAGVTYWVEYAPAGGGFQVYDTYAHRMEIAGEGRPLGGENAGGEWQCAGCGVPLTAGRVPLVYLGSEFPVELPRCPQCGLVLIAADLALGKMREVEQELEDK